MATPKTTECLKGPGCPPGVDLRECTKWPNNCPLVHVQGDNIILESPQQKLFPDILDDTGYISRITRCSETDK